MKKLGIKELLKLKKGDVVSIVGSGGKTSFMYELAKECSFNSKVLVTTSTKIEKPKANEVDYEFYTTKSNEFRNNNGITLIGDYINMENKVVCSEDTMKNYIEKFDYTLIESDGSKRKPLKGWNNNEPVILSKTTKTVGIIPVTVLDLEVNYKNIHRLEEFKKLTNAKEQEKVTLDHLIEIVINPNGLFKNSIGQRILFLNCIEDEKYEELARNLLEKISRENNKFLNKVLGGSIRNSVFFELN